MSETLGTILVVFGSIAIVGIVLAFYITRNCDRHHEEEHEYEADNYRHMNETKDI